MLTPETISCDAANAGRDAAPERSAACPHCGHALDTAWLIETLGARWLSKRHLLHHLSISNTQRVRLQRQGVLPPPTFALGMHSGRWRMADLDAVMELARRPRREARPDADAAVAQVLRNLNGSHGGRDAGAQPPPMQPGEWR